MLSSKTYNTPRLLGRLVLDAPVVGHHGQVMLSSLSTVNNTNILMLIPTNTSTDRSLTSISCHLPVSSVLDIAAPDCGGFSDDDDGG